MKNLTIVSRRNDVASFYNQASVVLNLSDKTKFVETFGLTALEAMSAGLPVIVPTEGGIAEMVEDGVNGYKIDVQELAHIQEAIATLLSQKEQYAELSGHALGISEKYSPDSMLDALEQILCSEGQGVNSL